MKIKTLYIKNFGRLKNFKLNLRPGLNIIYGDNEAGKTTIMNFIKMMFYGSHSKSSDIGKNPRKKYLPWDGSAMSGYIEFEFKRTNYRLEREFRSSNLTDIIALWNLDTSQEEPLSCKRDIGEQFFGIGASAFEKSVFIGNASSVISSSDKDDEISKRLMNFATSCDESVSYEIVRQRLKKAHDELHNRNGELNRLRQTLSDKTELLEQAEILYQKKADDEALLDSFCMHLKRKTSYYSKISNSIKEQHIIRELHSLETQNRKNAVKDELRRKLDQLYAKISNGKFTVTEGFIDECENMLSRISILKQIYSDKKVEFNALDKELSELRLSEKIQNNYLELDVLSDKKTELKEKIAESEKLIEALHERAGELQEKLSQTRLKEEAYNDHLAEMESNNNSLLINYILPVIAVFIAVLALLLKNPWILIALIPAVAVIFTAAKAVDLIKKIREKKHPELVEKAPDYEGAYREFDKAIAENTENIKKKQQDLLLLKDEYADADKKEHDLEIFNNKLVSQNEQKLNEQNKINSGLSSISSELTTLNVDLITLFSSFRSVSGIPEIEDHIAESRSILAEIEKTKAVLSSRYEEDIISDSPEDVRLRIRNLRIKLSDLTQNSKPRLLNDEQIDSLESDLEETKNEITRLNDEITTLRTKLSTQYSDTYTPEEIKTEISDIKSNISYMQSYLESLKIALSIIDESGNEIRQTFGPKLNSKTQKIFGHLTTGKYNDVLVSKNLEINTKENQNSQIRDWQYMSSGTADQAYFSLRLAIADMITQNKIPLFLDDVFAQYDDTRAQKGFEFIAQYSRLNQVLLFTCHRYNNYTDKYIILQ